MHGLQRNQFSRLIRQKQMRVLIYFAATRLLLDFDSVMGRQFEHENSIIKEPR